jgi:hypothetical protein
VVLDLPATETQWGLKRILLAAAAATALATGTVHADEHGQPRGTFGELDHVFLIMMENETNTDILGNPSAPTNLVVIDVAEMRETYTNCLLTPSDKRKLRFVRSFIEVASEVLGV